MNTDQQGADHDIAQLRAIACAAARAAGELIVSRRPSDLDIATKSSSTDVVTVMDKRSEELLREFLAEHRPGDGVLGEEGARADSDSGITWVVDPIDGTVNYLYGIGAYAVSVAACSGDVTTPGDYQVLAGAVFNPVTDELFHAGRAQGAAMRSVGAEERTLDVSSCADLGQALVGTGFGYEAKVRERQGAVVARLLPQIRDIRRGGSAALDMCFVAAGRLDVYYESGTHIWDRAAGELIVTEAGGIVTGMRGEPSGRAMTIAGNSTLVTALEQLI